MAGLGLSGTYIIVAWVIAGIFSMLGAFVIAGLANLTEKSGGLYEYLRVSLGGFLAYLFGWSIFSVIGSASVAALAYVFAQSLNTLVPLHEPLSGYNDLNLGGFIFPFASSGVKIFAIAAIVLLTYVNYTGVKKSAGLNSILTWTKVAGILLLLVAGLALGGGSSGESVAPVSQTANIPFLSALFGAMLSAFWAYDGWSNLPMVTGEIKNPKRNVPLSIIGGLSIVMALYVGVNIAYLHTLPVATLAGVGENQIAAAKVAEAIMGEPGSKFISVLIMISTFGALNVIIFVYARLYMRMAEEGSFFPAMKKIHPRFKTPHVALWVATLWAAVLVISGTFDMLTNLIIFSEFFFFILAAVALIKMKRNGTIKAKVIGYPVVPVIIIIFALALLVNTLWLQPKQSLLGLLLMLSGVPLYLYFNRKRKSLKTN